MERGRTIILFIALFIAGVLIAGCASSNDMNWGQPAVEKLQTLLIKLPADTAETMYFRGISARKRSLQEALKDAENDARIRVSGYISYLVEEKIEDATRYRASNGRVVENTETALIASSSSTSAVLNGVKTIDEQITPRSPDGTVEVQIVVAVDRKLLEQATDDFNTKRAAARTLRFINVRVYTASNEVIAEIAADTNINLGALNCILSYSGVRDEQSVHVGGTVRFRIKPARLSPGMHSGVLELQIKKIAPGVENLRRDITFEITKDDLPPFWFLWNGDDSWKYKWIYAGLRVGIAPHNYVLNTSAHLSAEQHSSFEIAALCDLQLFSLLSLQTEIVFSADKVSVDNPDHGIISASSNTLSIPLLAKLTVKPGIFYLSAFTGPNFIFPLGQLELTQNGASTFYDFSSTVGWTVGADAGMQLGPGILFLDLRYTGDFKFVQSNGEGQYRRNIFSISLGYNYGFIDKTREGVQHEFF
ncbi:MAG: porin family protein [Spirochaetaceae bacterium]|jgi:hypothetical protein|nr:porin family protein [Spirochaetaceae bacterium]